MHRGMDATHKTFETTCNARAWPHQYWKSCANGSNFVALRFGDHGTKEMLGVVGSFKLCATTCNKVCKRTQHVTSNNLASVARSLTLHKRRYPIYHDLFLVVYAGSIILSEFASRVHPRGSVSEVCRRVFRRKKRKHTEGTTNYLEVEITSKFP